MLLNTVISFIYEFSFVSYYWIHFNDNSCMFTRIVYFLYLSVTSACHFHISFNYHVVI